MDKRDSVLLFLYQSGYSVWSLLHMTVDNDWYTRQWLPIYFAFLQFLHSGVMVNNLQFYCKTSNISWAKKKWQWPKFYHLYIWDTCERPSWSWRRICGYITEFYLQNIENENFLLISSKCSSCSPIASCPPYC